MMWALEYDPDLFATYEDEGDVRDGTKGKAKSKKQCGKFERENLRNGAAAPLPISVFLVASVLKDKSTKLQTEARGLDEVVKVGFHPLSAYMKLYLLLTIHSFSDTQRHNWQHRC